MENIENIVINNNLIRFNNKENKMVDNLILKELNKKFVHFNDIFKNFTYLEENDKIIFDEDNNVIIDKYSYFQCFKRWYNGYNSQIMREKFNKIFINYKDFIRLIQIKLNSYKNIKYIDLCLKVLDLNKKIKKGLIVLIETYKNNKEIFKFLNDMTYNIDLCSSRLKSTHIYKKYFSNL